MIDHHVTDSVQEAVARDRRTPAHGVANKFQCGNICLPVLSISPILFVRMQHAICWANLVNWEILIRALSEAKGRNCALNRCQK